MWQVSYPPANGVSQGNYFLAKCDFSLKQLNGTKKESPLDHVYVNNSATVNNVNYITPTFGNQVIDKN